MLRRRRGRGLLVAPRGVDVLRLALDRVHLGDHLAGVAHVALLEGAPQPVVDHRVDDLAGAHAPAFPRVRQQVGSAAHRLHAAGDDDVHVADGDALGGEHHRLQAGAAHLVDGQRRDVVGQAAAKRGLSRGVLSETGADHVAHDALVDQGRIDARATNRFGDDERAELGRGEVLQRAEKLARRRADRADDHRFAHFASTTPRGATKPRHRRSTTSR